MERSVRRDLNIALSVQSISLRHCFPVRTLQAVLAIVPTNPQYRPLTRKISDEREALQTKLNAEDSERLEVLGEM